MLILISVLATLALFEFGLRAAGYEPFTYRQTNSFANKYFKSGHVRDPVNGYAPKPGKYFRNYLPDGSYPVMVTISRDGGRRSSDIATTPPRRHIYFIGGSMTFGEGVSDGRTYSDRVAAQTEFASINIGVAGYGLLQSLEMLKRSAAKWTSDNRPAAVIYGLVTHHATRDVADWSWLRSFDRNHDRANPVLIPKARLDDRMELVRYPPDIYAAWPFREHSALIALAELSWVQYAWSVDEIEKMQIFEHLIKGARDLLATHGVPLYVAAIYMSHHDYGRYEPRLKSLGVKSAYCSHATWQKDGLVVPNDGHPNPIVHKFYADCIVQNIIPWIRAQ